MTSATRRSAQAALAESTIRKAPHSAAIHDEMRLFILNSGGSPPQFISIILSQNVHARMAVIDQRSCGEAGEAAGVRSPLLSTESASNRRAAHGRRDFRHRGQVGAYVVRAEA